MKTGTVLVVGGTGHVGSKVVKSLQRRGVPVRVLVRPGSDASAIEGQGVVISRGDMMDPASLDQAFSGVDAVISCAAGYTRRRKTDRSDIDQAGNRNLAQAAKKAGIRRFVLNSILQCDDAPGVKHFEHKSDAESYLRELGVPFVSIRPGAFLDQAQDFVADNAKKNVFFGIGDRDQTRWTWIYTGDLAESLVKAVFADDRIVGKCVDVGWSTGPLNNQELADAIASATGRTFKVKIVPWGLVRVLTAFTGLLGIDASEMGRMFLYFRSGRYVADTKLHDELLGPSPTKEDAIKRWAIEKGLGHGYSDHPTLSSQEPKSAKGYWLVQATVTNPAQFGKYTQVAGPVIASYGGRVLARGEIAEVVEGSVPRRPYFVEFPNYAAARSCFYSAAYQEAITLRSGAAQFDIVIVDGVPVEQKQEG